MENSLLNDKIIMLWHISRTALATMPTVPSMHDRMLYIKDSLILHYPNTVKGMSNKQIWFAIEEALN